MGLLFLSQPQVRGAALWALRFEVGGNRNLFLPLTSSEAVLKRSDPSTLGQATEGSGREILNLVTGYE